MNYIGFDLEGPLSPQDNAYDLMGLFPDGGKIFEVISRYDDLLTLESKADYEPGDTLALIVPFLIRHSVTEADITALATKADFTGGAAELISKLQSGHWNVFCITTTYRQYATHITQKLGINADNIACTSFPLDKLRVSLGKEDAELLQQTEEEILTMRPGADDDRIKQSLDNFFRERLPKTSLGPAITEVKPIGGRRKVAALTRFAEAHAQPLSDWAVVGDSITDTRMLQAVDKAGGLAIVFNGNSYALPPATMSLASTNIGNLIEILQTWQQGGRQATEKLVWEKERAGDDEKNGYFHWLDGKGNIDDVIEIHQKMRGLVRKAAGKLG